MELDVFIFDRSKHSIVLQLASEQLLATRI